MVQSTDTQRIEKLLRAMTLEDKIGQLCMISADWGEDGPALSSDRSAAIRAGRVGSVLNLWGADRTREMQSMAVKETPLGIPLLFAFDVLHGHETIFPIPLGEAAAFNPGLWERTARAAAEEAAAAGIALTFAPMLDVTRDPRWGRIAESPGEDPCVASRFAEAKIRGFEGADLAVPQTLAATAKHLGAYGAVTAGRDYASVDISGRLLHEVYLPPFLAAVRANVAAIMPAFSDLAGIPIAANSAILRDLVRKHWGFEGVIISDYEAIAELVIHGVAADLAEAAALAITAGVDIDMTSEAYPKGLPGALERGLIVEEDIDRSVRRVLTLKERLGLFDSPYARGREQLSPAQFEANRQLSRDAARRSIVLLQDRDGLLPLPATKQRLAVIGPLASAKREMLGPWSGAGRCEDAVSFLDGLRSALPQCEITHVAGTGIDDEDAGGIAGAVDLASQTDMTVLCLGEAAEMSGEAASRAQPDLPVCQRELAERVLELGKPVIVTLTSGRPLIVPWLFAQAPTVLATWFLGSQAGNALADVLTGAWAPSAKLPFSWPYDVGQIPIFYAQRPTGRPARADYRYSAKYIDIPVEPQFPFGHGLSYTRFSYRNLRVVPDVVHAGGGFCVEVEIANEGAVPGEETALLFIRDPVASVARPVLELKRFAKIMLEAGTSGTVRFKLSPDDLTFPGEDGTPRLEPGEFEVLVGPKADREALLSCRVRLAE